MVVPIVAHNLISLPQADNLVSQLTNQYLFWVWKENQVARENQEEYQENIRLHADVFIG